MKKINLQESNIKYDAWKEAELGLLESYKKKRIIADNGTIPTNGVERLSRTNN